MNNIKKTWIKKGLIGFFSILLIILILIIIFYFLKSNKLTLIDTNSWTLLKSNTGIINTWSGTWQWLSSTVDKHIQAIDDTDIDKALSLALKRYNDNEGKNLWDYAQLTYIYIDKWDYDKVIKLWKNALVLIDDNWITEKWIVKAIVSQLIQAYLYKWDLDNSWILVKKYSYLPMLIEKLMYDYKKWNYKNVINNYEDIKKLDSNDIWFWLILLAKSYDKKWDKINAIKTYEELFNYWVDIELEQPLDATFILYYCSYVLSNDFVKDLSQEKLNYYINQNLIYKNRINNKEKIKNLESDIDLYYNPDLMFFYINRIMNF